MKKKILIVFGVLVGLLLAANGVVAVVPSVREAITGLPLKDQIFFLANEIDQLRACRDMDNLKQMPARTELEVSATYWGQGTVEEALAYLDLAAGGKEIEPCWEYTDPSKTTDQCGEVTQAEIDQTISFLKDRYQSYLSAKERCGE